jgi:hypothetical protein
MISSTRFFGHVEFDEHSRATSLLSILQYLKSEKIALSMLQCHQDWLNPSRMRFEFESTTPLTEQCTQRLASILASNS